MFCGTHPFGSCIKRELKGSSNFVDAKDSFLLQARWKNLRNPFHFRRRALQLHTLYSRRISWEILTVPRCLYCSGVKSFTLKGEGHRAAPPLCASISVKTFQCSSVSDKTIRAFGRVGHLCDRRISLKVTGMPFRWKSTKTEKYRKRKHPSSKYSGRTMPTQRFHTLI